MDDCSTEPCGKRNGQAAAFPERWALQTLDHLPDAIFATDDDFQLHYLNQAAERIIGMAGRDVLGKDLLNVFAASIRGFRPSLQSVIQKRTPFNDLEFRMAMEDGSSVPVICNIRRIPDKRGRSTGWVMVIRDVAALKRLEGDLRLSEKKYRRIFEGSKDMIFITSRQGAFKDINQAGVELLGYESKEELLSLESVDNVYFNPIHRKVFQKQIERHGYVKDFEVRLKRKDGTSIHCLLSGNAVRGADGDVIGYEGIVKDITARMDAVRKIQKRHRELSLLNAVALAMNKSQELPDILLTALKKALEVLNLTAGAIFLIDHENRTFLLKAQQGLPVNPLTETDGVLLRDKALMQAMLKRDLTLTPKPTFPPFRATLRSLHATGFVQLTCFLITAKERASGFFAFSVPPSRTLTDQDLHLLGSLGNFLGGAIENAQLVQTIKRHQQELKVLTARLLHSQESERRRIARELHDEAGQALTAINFTLETIEKNFSNGQQHLREHVSEVKKQINRTYREMRRISYRLHPALLSDLGLEPALDSYLAAISRHTQMEIDFKMVGFEGRVDPDVETVLYRLSQEALTNALKHAQARRFSLSLIRSYPHIIFVAEDDGVGFEAAECGRTGRGLGLLCMRERAAMLGGRFSLRSSRGRGTRIRIEIPIAGSFRGE